MPMVRTAALALSFGFSPFCFAGGAFAAGTEVNVSIWDQGDATMKVMADAAPMGMAMIADDKMAEAMATAPMGMKWDLAEVPAGEVTFNLTNMSEIMAHELVVAPLADATKPVPYDDAKKQVDEDAVGAMGEVEETEPGNTGTLTLTLEPGTYLLFCNIPGHYMAGLWTVITVKG